MLKKILTCLILTLILFNSKALSQTFNNGCLITSYNPDRIYITLSGGSFYITVCNGQSPSNSYAYAVGSLGNLGSCNDGTYNGRRTSFTVAQCPLDDYVPYLLLLVSGFGFIYMKKYNLFVRYMS